MSRELRNASDEMLEQARQEAAGYAAEAEATGDLDAMDEYADMLFHVEQEQMKRNKRS